MPRPAWFRELFGFDEGPSFSANRARFNFADGVLNCPSAPVHGREQFVGEFGTPSVAELRVQLAEMPGVEALGGLSFAHLATPTGVQTLIMDPENASAVFQAASQFNALEMVGPGVSPAQGVAIYFNDPTQASFF